MSTCETHHLHKMQLMGIAEFIIGRAFARPVGSTHPTRFLEHSLCGVDDRVERRPLSEPKPTSMGNDKTPAFDPNAGHRRLPA